VGSRQNKIMLQTALTVGKFALITVASIRGLYDTYQVGAWTVNKIRGPKPLPQMVTQPVAQAPAVQPIEAQVVASAPAHAQHA